MMALKCFDLIPEDWCVFRAIVVYGPVVNPSAEICEEVAREESED